jgi:hypothetical protein
MPPPDGVAKADFQLQGRARRDEQVTDVNVKRQADPAYCAEIDTLAALCFANRFHFHAGPGRQLFLCQPVRQTGRLNLFTVGLSAPHFSLPVEKLRHGARQPVPLGTRHLLS